jgi:tyrosine phenol-lyase
MRGGVAVLGIQCIFPHASADQSARWGFKTNNKNTNQMTTDKMESKMNQSAVSAPHQSWAEPWRIKVIEPIRRMGSAERETAIEEAGFNTFLLRSREVYIDLLPDSGTGAMSDRQWAAMMRGDEAYAGSESFYRLEEAIRKYYGYEYVVPTHQGRGAEHLLSMALIRKGDTVPGNMYFTTTRLHQEMAGGTFRDAICPEAHDPNDQSPFKGNFDLVLLERIIEEAGEGRVPYICVGATVNMAGGQPISMENMRAVREIADRHKVRIMLDATRAVENAYFIQQREEGYAGASVASILKEFCDMSDGCTMSGKKDALVNIGGWVALRDTALYEELCNLAVVYEGLHTYGGMSGRDMEAMAIGISESVDDDHIRSRIGQVEYLGRRLIDLGIPVIRPIGGHAVYLDARAFYPHIPQDDFPAQTLAANLYLDSGVRSMERGIVSAGRDPETGEHRHPKLELVRLTIPRRVYTQSHMDVVAESVARVHASRDGAVGLEMIHEPRYLRFFQARFRRKPMV